MKTTARTIIFMFLCMAMAVQGAVAQGYEDGVRQLETGSNKDEQLISLAGKAVANKDVRGIMECSKLIMASSSMKPETAGETLASILYESLGLLDDEQVRTIVDGIMRLNVSSEETIQLVAFTLALSGREQMFDRFVSSGVMKRLSVEPAYELLKMSAVFFAREGHNLKKGIELLLQATNMAEKNGRSDLNFEKITTYRPRHNYLTIAQFYDQLGDKVAYMKYEELNTAEIGRKFGTESREYYDSVKDLAVLFSGIFNDYEKSLYYSRKALAVAEKTFGRDSEVTKEALMALAGELKIAGKYKDVLSLTDSILQRTDLSNNERAGLYNYQTVANIYLFKIEDAFRSSDKAISLADNDKDRMTYCIGRSEVFYANALYLEAAQYLEDCVANHTLALDRMNNWLKHLYYEKLACAYTMIDRPKAYRLFDEAEQYLDFPGSENDQIRHFLNKSEVAPDFFLERQALEKALAIFKNTGSRDSMTYAVILNDLGLMYYSYRDYDKAERYYRESYAICARNGWGNTRNGYDALCNLGIAYSGKKDYDKAITVLTLVCALEEKTRNVNGDTRRNVILNLLLSYIEAGRYDDAREFVRLGEEYGVTSDPAFMYLKAKLLLKLKKYDEAEHIFLNLIALKANENNIAMDLLELYRATGQKDKALQYEIKSVKGKKDYLTARLLYLTEKERRFSINDISTTLNSFLAGADASASLVPAVDLSLFCRSLLLNTGSTVRRVAMNNSGSRQAFEEMLSLRRQALAFSGTGDKAYAEKLNHKADSLELTITYNTMGLERLRKLLNFSTSDLRESLQDGDAAVDFQTVTRGDTTTYVALVVTRQSEPKMVKIGTERQLKQLLTDGMTDEDVFNLIWKPVTAELRSCRRVFFTASGLLHKAPIEEALTQEKPETEAHRLFHLSDIQALEDSGLRHIYAFGDPLYSGEPVASADVDASDVAMRGKYWQPIPYTREEVRNLERSMATVKGAEIHVYLGEEANECNFKQLNGKEVNLLHIATHGLFADDETIKRSGREALKDVLTDGDRSGLVFSGANTGWNDAAFPAGYEDGILTCREIENMYMSDLNLVVLSACNTGLGEANIDGVWGLQRAFRIAGARRLIVSLVPIADDKAQAFMSVFYQNLAAGSGVYASFAKARQQADRRTAKAIILIE